MIKQVMIAGIMLILSIWDVRKCAVPVWILRIGMAMAMTACLWDCVFLARNPADILAGSIPGLLMLGIAYLTQKAGPADGIVLTGLGMVLGYRNVLLILCGSLWLIALFSVVLLCLKKVNKDSRLPYLPFLGIAGLAVIFLGR